MSGHDAKQNPDPGPSIAHDTSTARTTRAGALRPS